MQPTSPLKASRPIRTRRGSLLALSALGTATAALVWFLGSPRNAEAQDPETACYAIADITIHDRDEYRKYEAGFSEVFSKYGGTILAGSEAPEILEGEWPYTRAVLIRFPSRQALSTWYDSPEYQKIAQHRFAASRADIIVLPGRI